MKLRNVVKKNSYYDSATLMLLSSKVGERIGSYGGSFLPGGQAVRADGDFAGVPDGMLLLYELSYESPV